MFTAKCLAQGSSGNCWVLNYDGHMLILDAGIHSRYIKQGIDYNLLGVRGVCISHVHTDHSLAVKDLRNMGLNVFTPYENVNPPKVVDMSPFRIQPISVPHGDCNCYAFFIKVADRRIIYITDFEKCDFNFRGVGLTDIIVECNYQDEYLDMDAENINHKVIDHCSLSTCKEFVRTNATSSLENVILTHLGVGTCDGNECAEEVRKVVLGACSVDYARAGHTYILSKGE